MKIMVFKKNPKKFCRVILKSKIFFVLSVVFLASLAGGMAGIYFSEIRTAQLLNDFGARQSQLALIKFPPIAISTSTPAATTSTVALANNPLVSADQSTEKIISSTVSSVVSVVATKKMITAEANADLQISIDGEPEEVGAGSGFIVSADGLIITNKHVVSDEAADYSVILNNGQKYPAKVLGRDSLTDLAIIKIEKKYLTALTLGDSSKLQLGQQVMAVGNALGEFQNTVSSGIVSGLNRSVQAVGDGVVEKLSGLIQVDAPINLGNSGGPLINARGEVVGINTAMASGAQSIGFAIPINDAKKIITSVKRYGRIVRPWLGVQYVLVDEELKQQKALSVNYGALLISSDDGTLAVATDSPAAKAGLREGDIVLQIDGQKITTEHPLGNIIGNQNVGQTVILKVLSQSFNKTIKVKLEERK